MNFKDIKIRQEFRQKKSIVRRIKAILGPKDRIRVVQIISIQIFLSILDLVALSLIAVIAAIGLGSKEMNLLADLLERVFNLVNFGNIQNRDLLLVAFILCIVFLLSKTIFSMFVTHKIIQFFSRIGAEISLGLFNQLLSKGLVFVQSRPSQEFLYATTRGVDFLSLQIIATICILAADVSLLIFLFILLLYVDIPTTIVTLAFFLIIGILLNTISHKKSAKMGQLNMQLNIKSNILFTDVLSSFREARTNSLVNFYSRIFKSQRDALSSTNASLNFIPYVSKYVFESSIILLAVIVGFVQYSLGDPKSAIFKFSVFLIASGRIGPALLRIQQSSIVIKTGMGMASETLKLMDETGDNPKSSFELVPVETLSLPVPSINLEKVSFKYPDSSKLALEGVDMRIEPGNLIAIVGSTGSGKSTLVDLILGLLSPTYGCSQISGICSTETLGRFEQDIYYVSQQSFVMQGTIRENLLLGSSDADEDRLKKAISCSGLSEFIDSIPEGLNYEVGERGSKLSGGQKQKLSLARAFYSCPKLLILDEPTSALDRESENLVISKLVELRDLGQTVIIVTHDLEILNRVNCVYYLEDGKIGAQGELRVIQEEPVFQKFLESGN
jgi:ABC-type bacteriocin/lantibiotic exporter with double-glycine peptidase domain